MILGNELGLLQWYCFLLPDSLSIPALARFPGEGARSRARERAGDGASPLSLARKAELEQGENRQIVPGKWSVARC